MKDLIKKYALYDIFTISLVATLVSLYFSYILGWEPCVLCWYQRIFIYPIVIVSGVAILYKDTKVARYILPLSILGGLIAFFHNLLYWKIIPETFVPCKNGVSCTAEYLSLFGFVTIPLLSLIAFILISYLAILYKNYENE